MNELENNSKIENTVLKIENFSFRKLDFYKQPEVSNEMETITQAEIMEYIVNEIFNLNTDTDYIELDDIVL